VHIDPPAMAIAVTSFLLLGLGPWIGLYNIQGGIAAIVVIVIAAVYSFFEFNWVKKQTVK
jgi:hypothetical protein